jgi:hypothetical protein
VDVDGNKYHLSNRDRVFEIIEGSLTGIATIYTIPFIIPIGLIIVLHKIKEKTK